MNPRFVVTLLVATAISVGSTPVARAQTFGNVQPIAVPPEGGSTGAFGLVSDIDGTTAVIGSPDETASGALLAGAAYVMVRNGSGAWVPQQRLSVGTADRHFGSAVAVSGDTIAVGSKPTSAFNTATVRVYVRSGTTWTLQQEMGAHRATSLRLKGDTLAVGDIDRTSQGEVTVYERTGTVWGAGATLTAAGGTVNNGQFGAAVDLSGSTLCIGVPKDTANGVLTAGSVRVLTRGGPGSWTEQQKINGPDTNSFFGSACSVDGDTLLIGALNVTNGRAYVYGRSGATWSQQQQLTIPQVSGNVAGQHGRVVGDVAVVGGFRNLSVFARSGATWTPTQTIPVPADGFGGIGLTPTYLIAGTNPAGAQHGTAYVYTLQATGPPGAPTNLQASVDGSNVSLSWGAPTTGAAPTNYILIARTAAGAPLRTIDMGLATAFVTPAPNGAYRVSVAASNSFGTGPESAPQTFSVPSLPAPPGVPGTLAAAVSGSTATFTWAPPASGGAPSSYTLIAGLTPGFTTPIATLPVPAPSTTLTVPGVPNGTYYVRLVAQNAGGISGAGNEVVVTVGAVAPPGAPTLNPPQVVGNTVSLSWTPGAGPAPTSYVLIARVGGVPIGALPFPGTSTAIPGVPSGTYSLTLVALNAAGASAPSNAVTLVVP